MSSCPTFRLTSYPDLISVHPLPLLLPNVKVLWPIQDRCTEWLLPTHSTYRGGSLNSVCRVEFINIYQTTALLLLSSTSCDCYLTRGPNPEYTVTPTYTRTVSVVLNKDNHGQRTGTLILTWSRHVKTIVLFLYPLPSEEGPSRRKILPLISTSSKGSFWFRFYEFRVFPSPTTLAGRPTLSVSGDP